MKKILVSDFDGVICNGLPEYFHSTKLAFQEIWGKDRSLDELQQLQPQFNRLRPVIETGWEMPVLIKALLAGVSEAEILNDWHTVKTKLSEDLEREQQLQTKDIAKILDNIRQQQIDRELETWLSRHDFYEGTIAKLKQIMEQGTTLYILTTKEGSFSRVLLEQQGIKLPSHQIIGKEVKRPKYESLKLILAQENIDGDNAPCVSFIEDRLEALELVHQQPELKGVNLYLADWGYNTIATQEKAKKSSHVQVLSLAKFTGNDVF